MGIDIDKELIEKGLESAKKRALRLLSKRSYSEAEIKKKLTDKGESEQIAGETVRWLVELGYLSDSDYATSIVSHYTAKGYGQARIRDELYKRGIPRDMWDEKLAAPEIKEGEDNPAVLFLKRKLRGSREKEDLQRVTGALVRRGFSYDEAKDAVNSYLSEGTEQ